jgi:hypothetical protein
MHLTLHQYVAKPEQYKTTPFIIRRLSYAPFVLRVVINLEQGIDIDTHHDKVGCCTSEIVSVCSFVTEVCPPV